MPEDKVSAAIYDSDGNRGRLGPTYRLPQHVRYGLATLGPVSSAGAQFILSLQLLRTLDPGTFGAFSFLLIASQLSFGLSSALFCAPLPVLLFRNGGGTTGAAVLRCLLTANLFAGAATFLILLGIGIWLGLPGASGLLFAAYGAVMLLRWFARAYAYAVGLQWRTITSDLIYSAALLGCIAIIWSFGNTSLTLPSAGLFAAAVISFLPFGFSYIAQQFLHFSVRCLSEYGSIWRAHSRWSLMGVLTTEATGNAHAYIVTLFSGPAQFAMIAASALLIRPVGVAMNALGEFERPRFGRLLGDRRKETLAGSLRFFRSALIAVWLATTLASVLLILYAPRFMFSAHYRLSDMIAGGILWLVVAAVRLVRTPESTLLQAAGQFRPLAFASVISSGISVALVAFLLLVSGPLWSIAGILVGEVVFALCIFRQTSRWRAHIAVSPAMAATEVAV